MNRSTRVALLTAALLGAGGLSTTAIASPVADVAPTTVSAERFLCAGSRVVDVLVCLDDSVFEPVPQLPGIVPDPRTLP